MQSTPGKKNKKPKGKVAGVRFNENLCLAIFAPPYLNRYLHTTTAFLHTQVFNKEKYRPVYIQCMSERQSIAVSFPHLCRTLGLTPGIRIGYKRFHSNRLKYQLAR